MLQLGAWPNVPKTNEKKTAQQSEDEKETSMN